MAEMPFAFRIDAMRADDIPALVAIRGAAPVDPAQLHDELARPWSRLWVTRDDEGTPTAFLVAWHVADELHVLNVATRHDQRRRGMARALLAHSLSYARAHGVRHVLLEVRRSNAPAIALYRAMGFFVTGVRSRYYPDDEDALEMVLQLDPAPATGEVVSREKREGEREGEGEPDVRLPLPPPRPGEGEPGEGAG
jgi:ribosomal-protein-alanine N-acetyltransferase